MASNKIHQLYLNLLYQHQSPEKIWPQWCSSKKTSKMREIIAIGAILTQRTSWRNADLALRNLKKASLLSLKKISELKNLSQLTELIRPAGFYKSKPKRLYDFCTFVIKNYGNLENFRKEDLQISRQELLSLKGIGPETADTILLYSLGKPSFVIDEYTKRLVKQKKLTDKFDYDDLKNLFEKNLPCDVKLYQKFHAFIIIAQKGETYSTMRKV